MASWNQTITSNDTSFTDPAWLAFLCEAINTRCFISGFAPPFIPAGYSATDAHGNTVYSITAGADVQSHVIWASLQTTISDYLMNSGIGKFLTIGAEFTPGNTDFNFIDYTDYYGAIGAPFDHPDFDGLQFERRRPREINIAHLPTVTNQTTGEVNQILSISGGTFVTSGNASNANFTAGDEVTMTFCFPTDYNVSFNPIDSGGVSTFYIDGFNVAGTPDLEAPRDTENNTVAPGMIAWCSGGAGAVFLGQLGTALPNPVNAPTCIGKNTGGSLAAGDHIISYTFLNAASNETISSPEVTCTITDDFATGSIKFTDFVADGDVLDMQAFGYFVKFCFFVTPGNTGYGQGSTVELQDGFSTVLATFVQQTPQDVCDAIYAQLITDAWTPYFIATQSGNVISLTAANIGAFWNVPINALSAGIEAKGMSGGTTNTGSIQITTDALPVGATAICIYDNEGFRDTSITNTFNYQFDWTGRAIPLLNLTSWYPAGATDTPDVLSNYDVAPNTVANAYNQCSPGDYIGPWLYSSMRTVLNMMSSKALDHNFFGSGTRPGVAATSNPLQITIPVLTDPDYFNLYGTAAAAEADRSAGYAGHAIVLGTYPIRRKMVESVGTDFRALIQNSWCQLTDTKTMNYGLARITHWYFMASRPDGSIAEGPNNVFDNEGDTWAVDNTLALWTVDPSAVTTDTVISAATTDNTEPPTWPTAPASGSNIIKWIGYQVVMAKAWQDYSVMGGLPELISSP